MLEQEGVVAKHGRSPTSFSLTTFEAWQQLVPFAFRADLWRYCVLWAHGGMYLDNKIVLTRDWTTWVWTGKAGYYRGSMVPLGYYTSDADSGPANQQEINVLSLISDRLPHAYCNGMMAVTRPRHAALARAIQMIVRNVQNT